MIMNELEYSSLTSTRDPPSCSCSTSPPSSAPRRSGLISRRFRGALNLTVAVQTEQARGVLLEHQRPHLVADRQLLEILQPAVGRDQREVRSEQHLVAQPRVRVLDEDLGKVLRRPAAQVDVDIRLVNGDRQCFVLPWERRA